MEDGICHVQRLGLMGRGGSVLILVVWTITLLSLLAAGLGGRGAFALSVADRLDQQLQASYLALGGVQHALMILARDFTPAVDGLQEEWVENEALFARQPLGAGSFTISYPKVLDDGSLKEVYGFVDEERKLHLNTAPEDVLRAFMRRVGRLRDNEALAVAQAIADWRDEDQDPRPFGAEGFYYQGLAQAYESKDGPFESVEELLLVKGITPALFARVSPDLTVYGSGRVNINTASRAALRALGVSEVGVSGIVFYRAGEDNMEGTADDRAVGAVAGITAELSAVVPAEDVNRLAQLVQEDFLSVHSEAFRLRITGQTESGKGLAHLECIVTRDGQIKAWTEY